MAIFLIISSNGKSAILPATNRHVPTGGVSKPTHRFTTTTTQNALNLFQD